MPVPLESYQRVLSIEPISTKLYQDAQLKGRGESQKERKQRTFLKNSQKFAFQALAFKQLIVDLFFSFFFF